MSQDLRALAVSATAAKHNEGTVCVKGEADNYLRFTAKTKAASTHNYSLNLTFTLNVIITYIYLRSNRVLLLAC